MNSIASDILPEDAPEVPPAASAPGDTRPLRWRLLALLAGGLLPLALAAAAAMFHIVQERERAAERNALATVRTLTAAVQAEIDATVAVLDALATAESLDQGRLDRFEQRARLVAESRGWRAVTLADGQGRLLFNSAVPASQGKAPVDAASLELALARGAPVVGRLVEGTRALGPAFPVRIPILREGQVRYVLSAVIGTEQVLSLVRRQQLPDSHVVAIFDPGGTRVARSLENASKRPSPTLQALMDRAGDEGTGPTRTLEGKPVITAVRRLPEMGWTVAVGISAEDARRALVASLAAAGAGLLASLGLSAWLAWFFSRKVSTPIAQLKEAAAALGRGEPVARPRLEIEELQEVGAALAQASRERERAAADRERAAAEREHLLAQATDALRRAEEAARSKDEFLAVLGHELRNPLAPISSALRLMAIKGDDATRAERRIVERQLGHMTRLVDDLLDVSRITSRKLAIRREPMRVGPWIEQAVDAARGSLGGRRLQVVLPDDAAHSWIEGDAVRLAQVLTNLLGNAVKFTAEDGSLHVSARRVDGHVEVAVADDGLGMAPQDVAAVFDLFYQAPQAQHRSQGGLGLGLPIVRSLVEMHGGEVAAASEGLGRGSCFTVRLPCVEAPAEAPAPAPSTAAPGVAAARVLVVDDNHDAADTAGALLEASGFEVQVAYTPAEALAALEGFAAQVALLDIGLPGMDGYQLAAAVRARPDGRRIRLVALTGYGQESDVERAHASGFDAHMTKPVGPDALLELVGRLAQEG